MPSPPCAMVAPVFFAMFATPAQRPDVALLRGGGGAPMLNRSRGWLRGRGRGPMVRPAARYRPAGDDLAIVTCYYNPCRYRSMRANFDRFYRSVAVSGLPIWVAECAFEDAPFELPAGPNILQLRAPHIMWMKERLLNLAIAQLPCDVTKVVWSDCDVLFENPNWAVETARLLERYPVVQPFHRALWLGPGQKMRDDGPGQSPGFAAIHAASPEVSRTGSFTEHGHTGLVWAARREVLEWVGLFDVGIAGAGDEVMAHGFCGDFDSPCIRFAFPGGGGYRARYDRWADLAWHVVRGRVGHVPGGVLHRWHGQERNRGYETRTEELARLGYDPDVDLEEDASGLWRWSGRNPELAAWAAGYFRQRREDDADGP